MQDPDLVVRHLLSFSPKSFNNNNVAAFQLAIDHLSLFIFEIFNVLLTFRDAFPLQI